MTLEHEHFIVRAETTSTPSDPKTMKKWMKQLIKTIDMQILGGPYAFYEEMEGNRGLTVVAIIKTSHIAMHAWDESNPGLIQLDVYSCKKFNPLDILNALQEFKPTKVECKFIDRDAGLAELKVPEIHETNN